MPRQLAFLALALTMVAVAVACRKSEPDYPEALREAEQLLRLRADEEAYQLLDRLRRRFPDQQAPYAYLAWAATRLGRPQDAIPALEERVARGGPQAHVYHDLLGTLLEEAGRWEEAEPQYREALRLEADYAPTYLKLSQLLARSGQYSKALELAGEGARRFPTDLALRSWYGDALRKRRRWDEAEHELRQVLALPGAAAYPHYSLGMVYLQTGRLEQARRELQIATELQPGAHEAWYQLAHTWELLGDREARDRALEKFAFAFRPSVQAREAQGAEPMPAAGP